MKNYKFTINGNKYNVDIVGIEDNIAQIEVNGTPYEVEMEVEKFVQPKAVVKLTPPPAPKAGSAGASIPKAPSAPTGGSSLKSPLPGAILDVFVKVGDHVKPGDHIVLLEAMKMENNIDADKEGVIKEIRVQRNDAVMEGDVLVVIG
ncbi:MAG TPA: biotin/lipoyl-binding protein [Bacteroidales bacterium]|nr:biotin/lipoyl-binding protein [Bacteroidales bacterium]HPS71966.1 biotin/lipoyl-binding protein [Bacteroidales bacterium]